MTGTIIRCLIDMNATNILIWLLSRSKGDGYLKKAPLSDICMCIELLFLKDRPVSLLIRYVTYPLVTGIKVISKCLLYPYLSNNRWWSWSIGDGYLKGPRYPIYACVWNNYIFKERHVSFFIRFVTYPLLTGIKVISKCLLYSYLSDNRWWSRSIGDGYLKRAPLSDICMCME